MRFDRLLLASAACALVAGAAAAQTTNTTTTTRSSTTGATTAQPSAGAASNTTGMSSGAMSGQTGAMSGAAGQNTTSGAMTGQTGMTSGAMGQTGAMSASAGAPFQQITPAAGANIVAVLQASGQFTTLLKAATATNLTSVLARPGNLTVFAPTDAAFAALPPGQLASLMQPANATQLQQFVLLHVVNTPIRSADLLNHAATNVPTVATGKSVHLDGSTGTLTVDGGPVLQSDVKASNGSIFVIGQALSPSYTPPAASAATAAPAADAATSDATATTTKSSSSKSTSAKKRKH